MVNPSFLVEIELDFQRFTKIASGNLTNWGFKLLEFQRPSQVGVGWKFICTLREEGFSECFNDHLRWGWVERQLGHLSFNDHPRSGWVEISAFIDTLGLTIMTPS